MNRYGIRVFATALGILGACGPTTSSSTGTGGSEAGGRTNTGGSAESGGNSGSGGASSTGGSVGSGGSNVSGGSVGTGGTSGTGGLAATGGTAGQSSTGGSQSGGSQSTGDIDGGSGGTATGGTSGTGGAPGTGGATSDNPDAAATDVAMDAPSDSDTGKSDWNAFLPLSTGTITQGDEGTTEDISGHGYAATYGAGVSFSDGAMVMSGTGDVWIPPKDSGPAIDVTKSYSVSVWVTLVETDGWRTMVSADGTTVSSFYLQKRADSGEFAFTLSKSDTNAGVSGPCVTPSSTKPEAGTLYHLVATRDANTGLNVLYVNGVQAGTKECPSSEGLGWSAGTFGIGHGMFESSFTDYVSGRLSGVGLMNRVLSADEVAALYAAGNK